MRRPRPSVRRPARACAATVLPGNGSTPPPAVTVTPGGSDPSAGAAVTPGGGARSAGAAVLTGGAWSAAGVGPARRFDGAPVGALLLAPLLILCLALAMAIGAAPAQAQGGAQGGAGPIGMPPPTVIVVDASNSQSALLGTESRLVTARGVLVQLVRDLPPTAEIGLVAFGHTKAADCRDVETLIPVAPLVVGEMIGQLDRMEPRGRAPLSAAIRAAAEALPRDRTRGNIVVVTDGPDTCAPDPCALTDMLATLPVDVTVQIVGLAPEAGGPELACFAEATGGRIEVVDTASSLASALRAAVVAPPTVVIRPVTAGGAAIPADRRFAWSVIEDASGRRVVDGRDAAVLRTSLPPGRYQVQAAGQVGSGRIAIEVGENDVRARLTLSDDVRVVPPPTAEIGAEIDVAWRGPDGPGDYLAIAEPGAPVTGFLTYARVSAGNPVTIAVPGAPGRFEVRYVDAAGNRILASAPIEVIAPDASLVAPSIVEALSEFTVAWTG
ncbi:MAG: VWA domain-containing protein, partial [Pseudomonadota bacterium]